MSKRDEAMPILHIVVADDESPILEWLVHTLSKYSEKYHVCGAAQSGTRAFELIEEHLPDLVITDIKMPGLTGLELMRKTAEKYPDIRFIILTNYADFAYAREAVVFGAFDYQLKTELDSNSLCQMLDRFAKSLYKEHQQQHLKVDENFFDLNPLTHINTIETLNNYWRHSGLRGQAQWPMVAVMLDSKPSETNALVLSGIVENNQSLAYNIGVAYGQACIVLSQVEERTIRHLALELNRSLGTCVGIGKTITEISEFPELLVTSKQAVEKGFLKNQRVVYLHEIFLNITGTSQQQAAEAERQFLAMIEQRDFWQAQKQISSLFHTLEDLYIDDVLYGRAAAKRVLLSVEQQRMATAQNIQPSDGAEQPSCLRDYRNLVNQYIMELLLASTNSQADAIVTAIEHLQKNYAENLTLSAMARMVYLSPEYFSRLFKEVTGDNFSTYLTTWRLSQARELLRSSDMTLTQIAAKVGYANPSYFAKLYRRYLGVSPENERKHK